MALVAELVAGVVLAVGSIVAIRFVRAQAEHSGYVFALVVAAFIYLIFGLRSGSSSWLLIEALGLVLFSAVAVSSLKFPRWILACGWLAHIVWDVALHRHSGSGGMGFVPEWYPATCAAYDLVIASYLAGQYWKQPAAPPQKLTPS